MAYNYLTLVNDVNRRLNEVELTSSNFASATGQYAQVKDAVNYAIRDINQDAYQWPFNYVVGTQVLVPGQTRYAYPSGYKTSNLDTYRIRRDATFGNDTRTLTVLAYEDYLAHHIDQEYNTSDEGIRSLPDYVFEARNLEFGVVPPPDEAYTLDFEYYSIPDDLEAATDVPTLPENFRKAINNGSMWYCYQFRGDVENTQIAAAKFEKDVKQLRGLYVNQWEYARGSMIVRDNTYGVVTKERVK